MPVNRRDFLQGAGASVLAATASGKGAAQARTTSDAPTHPRSRPNILHLQVDQMQWDAINNRSVCRTPNINRLVKEGIVFERSYTAASICCPSRAMLNTGSYQWHNGVFTQVHSAPGVQRDMFPDVITYSMRLKDAGYLQGFVGKWDVSYKRTPLDFGYDEIAAPIAYSKRLQKGIDTNPDRVPHPKAARVVNSEGAGVTVDHTFTWPGSKPFMMWGHFEMPEEETSSYFIAENGIRMMRRFAKKQQPWHLEVQWHEPHDPYVPMKKYLDRYNPADIPVPKSFYDTFAGKPELHRRESETWGPVNEDIYRQGRAHYYAYCEEVDAQIGRVLQALDEIGQAENTLVVFTTDHGDMCGAHRMWSKDWMPYEETYKIPMVMRWPGHIRPGEVSSHLVHVHDLAHTYVDAAGAAPLAYEEGRSLLPLAAEPDRKDWPDMILNSWYGGEFVRGLDMVITDRYKYIFNSFAWDELYDLHDDPDELHNQVDDPGHKAVVDDMRARMYELLAQLGSPYGEPSPNFNMPDCGQPNRYGAPRYLPRGKRMSTSV
jgi:arylsulfatase A-like enzyme